MWKELIILLSLFISIAVSEKTQCRHDSQCKTGVECCYYHTGPMVVSKKREVLPFNPMLMVQGGWCEKYREEGVSCSGIAEMNGHCGCNPTKGLKCTWIPDQLQTLPTLSLQTIPPVSRRRSMRPGGHNECRPAAP